MFSFTATSMRAMARSAAVWLTGAVLVLGVAGGLHAQTAPPLGWKFKYGNGWSIESSPAIGSDGTIYYGLSYGVDRSLGLVVAIDREGKPKWQFPVSGTLSDGVDSSPTVGPDGTIYIGCWNGTLYALNPNGTEKWEASGGSFVYSSPVLGADGTVYFGGGDGALHAVSPGGKERWAFPTGGFVYSSPAVDAKGNIYFGSWDNNIYAVNSAGRELWRVPTDSHVYAAPALGADGTVYIGSTDGSLYAIASDGKLRWKYHTSGSLLASPVLGADGTIYFGSADWNFYALTPNGEWKWQTSAGAQIASTAAVCTDGTIIFGAQYGDSDQGGNPYGRVVALEPDRGAVLWSYPIGYKVPVISSPAIADGAIYIGSVDGLLFKINAGLRPLSTVSSWPMFQRDAVHAGRATSPFSGRLLALSARAPAGIDTNLIAGLAVQGTAIKRFLVRAVGPTLGPLGVSTPLADPTLVIKIDGGFTLYENDNWGDDPAAAAQIANATAVVNAFPLPAASKDAAVYAALPPGPTTAVVGSANGGSGVALVEVYDASLDVIAAKLTGLSVRGKVGTGDNVLIPGLVIDGDGPLRVLVRAIGPGLADYGVTNVLAQPTLKIFSGQTVLRSNTGWTTDGMKGDIAGATQALSGLFALADGSADCALLVTLDPGVYTIQVSGVGDTTGEALVEVYAVP